MTAALAGDIFTAITSPLRTTKGPAVLTTTSNPQGLHLVEASAPRNTQALADDIVARIERDFARATPNRSSSTYVPISFFEPRRDTPVIVLGRVLKSLYSLAFSA